MGVGFRMDLPVGGVVDPAEPQREPTNDGRDRRRSHRHSPRTPGDTDARCEAMLPRGGGPSTARRPRRQRGYAGKRATSSRDACAARGRDRLVAGVAERLADDARRPRSSRAHPSRAWPGPGCPRGSRTGSSGGCGSNGIAFLLSAIPTSSHDGLGAACRRSRAAAGRTSARCESVPPRRSATPSSARPCASARDVRTTRCGVVGESRRPSPPSAQTALPAMHVLERPALHHREHRLVDRLRVLLAAQDDARRAGRAASCAW